jgi:hypothetical protein
VQTGAGKDLLFRLFSSLSDLSCPEVQDQTIQTEQSKDSLGQYIAVHSEYKSSGTLACRQEIGGMGLSLPASN